MWRCLCFCFISFFKIFHLFLFRTTADKKVWREEEEDELRVLFAEFERDQPGGGTFYTVLDFCCQYDYDLITFRFPDAVHWILSKLINQDRTANGVRKKLQELFLIAPKSVCFFKFFMLALSAYVEECKPY